MITTIPTRRALIATTSTSTWDAAAVGYDRAADGQLAASSRPLPVITVTTSPPHVDNTNGLGRATGAQAFHCCPNGEGYVAWKRLRPQEARFVVKQINQRRRTMGTPVTMPTPAPRICEFAGRASVARRDALYGFAILKTGLGRESRIV